MEAFTDTPGPMGIQARDAADGGEGEAGAEQRRGRRIRTVFRLAKVVRDRAIGLWRVRNISDFGMMLLTRSRLPRGERLTVMLSNQVAIDARVIWSDANACGVAFEKPIDSAATLMALVLEQREPGHRAPRIETRLHASIEGEDGIRPITVSNVSQQGIGFGHEASLPPGTRLRVLFDNGVARSAVVRWSEDQRAGVELLDPLSQEDLETILDPAPSDSAA
jgi:hypothetical protein